MAQRYPTGTFAAVMLMFVAIIYAAALLVALGTLGTGGGLVSWLLAIVPSPFLSYAAIRRPAGHIAWLGFVTLYAVVTALVWFWLLVSAFLPTGQAMPRSVGPVILLIVMPLTLAGYTAFGVGLKLSEAVETARRS